MFIKDLIYYFSEGDNDSGVDESTQGNVSTLKKKNVSPKKRIKLILVFFNKF